jgi:glycerophosphoryl diester phosphodiesterase
MKYIALLLNLVFIILGCQKNDLDISNLNNNEISVYGHGGMGIGQIYPINSFESLLYCLYTGTDGTELDVQMTKDSVLVAFHAEYLEQSTNATGYINDKLWNEISNVTYTNPPYTSYKLISLDELFTNLNNIHDFKYTFDCKLYNSQVDTNNYYVSYINAINNISDKYNLHNNLLIESKEKDFLTLLQKSRTDYKLFIYPNSFEEGLEIAKSMNLYGITISTENISKAQIEEAHENGFFVAIWNTNTKQRNIDAINKNPDFIQTDKVEYLVNLLN